jgi:hypothetical protein
MAQLTELLSLPERVVKHNTYDESVICLIEEMSELTKVLCKQQRKSSKFKEYDLVEELAHVKLMCNVLIETLKINDGTIFRIQLDAVERMEGIK